MYVNSIIYKANFGLYKLKCIIYQQKKIVFSYSAFAIVNLFSIYVS